MDVNEIACELTEIENTLDDWAERMISAIDDEATGNRAECAMAKVRKCVNECSQAFAEIFREFER